MRVASSGFCSTHSPVSANVARIPYEPNTSRIVDVLPASDPASKVSDTACSDVSPIQITSAGATGSVVEGGNVVERGNVVEVVDGGGAMVLVVVDITMLEEGCDVDGVDVRLVVATEVADTGDVVEVTGVVGAAVVATTDVVVV